MHGREIVVVEHIGTIEFLYIYQLRTTRPLKKFTKISLSTILHFYPIPFISLMPSFIIRIDE